MEADALCIYSDGRFLSLLMSLSLFFPLFGIYRNPICKIETAILNRKHFYLLQQISVYLCGDGKKMYRTNGRTENSNRILAEMLFNWSNILFVGKKKDSH